jgi:HD-like signal output (HDOD) protein
MQVAEVFDRASGRLPMIPKVVQQLVSSLSHADVINNDEITRTVGHDQVLTARVLRLANTPRFGGSRRVASLEDALIILGFDNVRVLVIASGVTGATAHIPDFDLKSFWQRCFEIANTARLLAQKTRKNPQLAFTCGLLTRIGELVLHVAVPAKTNEIDKRVEAGESRIEAERALLGVDSAQIGAELAWRWGFPELIINALSRHYPLDHPGEVPELAVLIGLAKLLVDDFNHGLSNAEVLGRIPLVVLERLGMTETQLAELLPDLKETSTASDGMF